MESAWLFTRGDQSVRIVRVGQRDGARRLMVHGPGDSRVEHEFDDMLTCAIQQSEIERRLVARSFRLSRFVGHDGARTPRVAVVPFAPEGTASSRSGRPQGTASSRSGRRIDATPELTPTA